MYLGNSFTQWGFAAKFGSPTKEEHDVELRALGSFNKMVQQYMPSVTSGQLVDGLNEFYRDYRNRSIQVSGAVWRVLNEIKGTPRKQLDELIESWRRNAK